MSKEIKQEIKETVTKLANANLEFTIEDELEFAKVAVKNAEQKLEQVKQENKRLLEIINEKPLETVDIDSFFEIEKLKEQLQAKEQECEELKEANDGLLKVQYQLADSCTKYEQTLIDIKEIAEKENNDTKVLYNRRTYQKMKQILQKISECGVKK